MREPKTIWLFSYGTLRQPEVQQELFGRPLESIGDVLAGFALTMLAITDPIVIATSGSDSHPIIRQTDNPDDEVTGSALALDEAELAHADAYEVDEYTRIAVRLKSGREAFVYVDHRDG